jgi:hypothetical protein
MTAPRREKRTQSFEGSEAEVGASKFVASSAEPHEQAVDTPQSRPFDSTGMPLDLHRSLRTARTPLIAGIDFKPADSERDAPLAHSAGTESSTFEKSRIDTLSPLDSVPPPAPYPAEAPKARPSVVPPVRLPAQSPRTRSDPPATGLRSDPPPRIPISDRPSRPVYRSDAPARASYSYPPPHSSGRGGHYRSSDEAGYGTDEPAALSADARRRQAVTIPADALSTAPVSEYDPASPLPALLVPNFPIGHLPTSIRQHENSRLRNVAMMMMFVIFIVVGAIAGMRWYVAREDEIPPTRNVAGPDGPRAPRMKLDRLEPNAIVAPHAANPTTGIDPDTPTQERSPATTNSRLLRTTSRNVDGPDASATNKRRDPTSVASPWGESPASGDAADGAPSEDRPANTANRTPMSTKQAGMTKPRRANASQPKTTQTQAHRKIDSGVNERVDTKTPLIMD